MAAPLNPVHAEIHPPVLPEVAAVAAEMLALRHDLHAHPELAYEEHRTGDIVAARLAEWGYEVHRGLGDTGVVGTLRCGEHAHGKHIGKRLGLRADMDALPIEEAKKKGAVAMFTKGLCTDLAKHGLQINGIAPGYFVTELTKPLVDNEEFSGWLCKRTPAGRWGNVKELTGAAIFLASEAADFVNGHVLYVDGGLTSCV